MIDNDRYNPFAPYVPKGMTLEQIKAEEEKLKRLQMEDEFAGIGTPSLKEKVKKTLEEES